MKSVRQKVFLSLGFAVVVYLALTIWSSLPELIAAMRDFNWVLFLPILGLSFINYLIRFAKWQYYLRILDITIPRSDSFLIFLSGLSMSITPGKVGEVIKSYFLKSHFDIPVTRTAPTVLADRLTDLLALVLLASIGAATLHYGQLQLAIVSLVIIVLLVIILWKRAAFACLSLFERWKPTKRFAPKLHRLYESSRQILLPQPLLITLVLSVLAWSCEAYGFYLTFQALSLPAGIGTAFFIYAFATIIGAVSMLPGGLGLTEGSMAGLLVLSNVSKATAGAATLIIRVATLWFAVILGAIALLVTQKKFRV